MKTISFDLERYTKPTTKANSERAELLEKFLNRLNPPRVEAGYKPLSAARLGMMLAHVPTEDLYPFYRECEQAKSFGKLFHYKLRV